jgi:putative DNA-invertase from lambdoid prophage Rac
MQLKRTRAVDVILVQALDRWGRSVQDMILTMAELEALGVTCLSASNTTSPTLPR